MEEDEKHTLLAYIQSYLGLQWIAYTCLKQRYVVRASQQKKKTNKKLLERNLCIHTVYSSAWDSSQVGISEFNTIFYM